MKRYTSTGVTFTMHGHPHARRGIWTATAIAALLLLAIAGFAVSTQEDPPVATVKINDTLSLDLVGVLTQSNRRVDLSPLSRRLFWKLPRPLRSTIFAFGRPAPSQMVRAFDIGPQDVKLVFVARGATDGAMAQEEITQALLTARMDHVRLNDGAGWQSNAVHLREEPVKGRKVIRTVQIEDVPTTTAQLTVDFVREADADVALATPGGGAKRVMISNPHYQAP